MKPLIGITAAYSDKHSVSEAYVHAVELAGGVPLLLPCCEDEKLALSAVRAVDGLLLTGGGDIDPEYYGEAQTVPPEDLSPRRDAFEIILTQAAIQQSRMPIFGICRGIQVLNVALGGQLYQDLEAAGKKKHSLALRDQVTHSVTIAPYSWLFQMVKTTELGVNSLHHQAIKTLAPGFVVTARSVDDGIAEAIELQGDRLVFGVQWHPETLIGSPQHMALFQAFVASAQR